MDIAGLLAAEKERYKLAGTGVPQAMVDALVAAARGRGERSARNEATLGKLRTPDKLGGGGGSGGGTTSRALSALIAKQELQLALLRETDPVQKEMLKNREALAGTTDTERASLEALIAQKFRNKRSMRSSRRSDRHSPTPPTTRSAG